MSNNLGSQINKDTFDLVHKGQKILIYISEWLKTPEAKLTKIAVKEVSLTYGLKTVVTISDPKRGSVIITATVLQKAMLVAESNPKKKLKECLEAIGNLATDFAMAGALGATTLGIGALLPLVLAAYDGYDVGNKCFVGNGPTTHAVKAPDRRSIKSALKTSKHGPI